MLDNQGELIVDRLLRAADGPDNGSAADMCREAAEWILKMRAASVLVETKGELPRLLLPYNFIRE